MKIKGDPYYECQCLYEVIRKRSRELAPDFPNIGKDLDVFEHLWAITSSCKGAASGMR